MEKDSNSAEYTVEQDVVEKSMVKQSMVERSVVEKPVCVGVIVSPHGLKGGVKVKVFTDDPQAIAAFSHVYIDGYEDSFNITSTQGNTKGCITVYFEQITSRIMAENVRKCQLYVDFSQLPELGEDEYYWDCLVGCHLILTANSSDKSLESHTSCDALPGENYGEVIAMHNFGAGDIMEVKLFGDEGAKDTDLDQDNIKKKKSAVTVKTIMLPFDKDSVILVDIAQKKVLYREEVVTKYE